MSVNLDPAIERRAATTRKPGRMTHGQNERNRCRSERLESLRSKSLLIRFGLDGLLFAVLRLGAFLVIDQARLVRALGQPFHHAGEKPGEHQVAEQGVAEKE